VIDAQAVAATTTLEFIQSFGMDEDGNAVMVDFTYATTNSTTGALYNTTLHVPLLTIIPIPFMRVRLWTLAHHPSKLFAWSTSFVVPRHVSQISECNIEFNAKLTSISTSESSSSTTETKDWERKRWWSSSRSSGSWSSQSSSNDTSSEAQEFTFNVKVRAVQDEMPAGLAKMISILEEAILFVWKVSPGSGVTGPTLKVLLLGFKLIFRDFLGFLFEPFILVTSICFVVLKIHIEQRHVGFLVRALRLGAAISLNQGIVIEHMELPSLSPGLLQKHKI
jgi:Protein of unknown function (DUF2589)